MIRMSAAARPEEIAAVLTTQLETGAWQTESSDMHTQSSEIA